MLDSARSSRRAPFLPVAGRSVMLRTPGSPPTRTRVPGRTRVPRVAHADLSRRAIGSLWVRVDGWFRCKISRPWTGPRRGPSTDCPPVPWRRARAGRCLPAGGAEARGPRSNRPVGVRLVRLIDQEHVEGGNAAVRHGESKLGQSADDDWIAAHVLHLADVDVRASVLGGRLTEDAGTKVTRSLPRRLARLQSRAKACSSSASRRPPGASPFGTRERPCRSRTTSPPQPGPRR